MDNTTVQTDKVKVHNWNDARRLAVLHAGKLAEEVDCERLLYNKALSAATVYIIDTGAGVHLRMREAGALTEKAIPF